MSGSYRTAVKAPADIPLDQLRQHPRNPRKISQVRLEQLQRREPTARGCPRARLGNHSRRVRGADIDLAGYLPADADAILRAAQPVSPRDPDDAPALPAEARSVRGQVYELGPHRVMCGDATDPGDVAALVGTHGPCEALWTDPPYGVSYVGKTAAALTIQGDDGDGLAALLQAAFASADAALADSARIYLAAPAGPRGTTFRLAVDHVGWRLHEVLVWVKDTMVLGHSDYHYQHEDVLYGWKPGAGRPGRGKHAGTRWYGDNAQTSVFAVDRPKRSSEHPTMKPVDLITQQLVNSTTIGDAVLDPFGGSGSTLIACETLNRRALLMEIDPGYCDVIRQRYADYTNQPHLAP